MRSMNTVPKVRLKSGQVCDDQDEDDDRQEERDDRPRLPQASRERELFLADLAISLQVVDREVVALDGFGRADGRLWLGHRRATRSVGIRLADIGLIRRLPRSRLIAFATGMTARTTHHPRPVHT